jgi:hypothetical protein
MKHDPRVEKRRGRQDRERREAQEANDTLRETPGSLEPELRANGINPSDDQAVADYLLR